MDQELKQRLIGAIVITALAVIFVPMLFDDPVDESGQMVNELALPEAPVKSFDETASRLPSDRAEELEEEGVAEEGEDFEPPEEEALDESGRELEAFDEEPVDEYEQESTVNEPIDDAGFEPEPFVEEPIYESEYESEPVVKAPAIKPEPAAPKPLAAVEKPVTPKPEPSVARPVVSKPEPAIKAPDIREADNASGTGGAGWYIQLGSFSQKENAFSLRDRLLSQGFPASVDEVNTGKGQSYRLKVGPELDKNRAQAMQAKLDKQIQTKSLLKAVGQTGPIKPSVSVATKPAPDTRSAARPETSVPQATSALVRWYIQLGSFSKQENAYALRDKLRAQGFPVSIEEVATASGKSYRLRVGPELDKKKAEAMQAKLEKQNHLNSLMVSE